ncbi:ferritin-like domain-containing protein [Dichomitus squalens]|uniref:Ferritin-like domain-containing protein n=1 Tax=Dichomitus squalens TaxID=114155 RepID=A0A4Q9MS02_9APHY|nr:ferritin-like domain-containing protein [Dichomitus squalens]TBU57885.1 ferritin-like domain-containing protein [Dichomitus squalens]
MFKRLQTIVCALAASSTVAAVAFGNNTSNDTQYLQVALSLHYVETAFYQQGLLHFDDQAFSDAGFEPWVRGRFEQIAMHGQTHTTTTLSALGNDSFSPCTYNFGSGLANVSLFVQASAVFSASSASRALYSQMLYQDVDNIIAAGAAGAVESRQAAWINSAVLKREPWSGPFETPLSLVGAYSLAEPSIVSCPDDYPDLPVRHGLPQLSFNTTIPDPGSFVKVQVSGLNYTGPKYLAWLSGPSVFYTNVRHDMVAAVPAGLQGLSYVALVSNTTATDLDNDLLSAFTYVDFIFNSYASNPGPSST